MSYSELRQDIVSGDWVLIATGRAKRPHQPDQKNNHAEQSETDCPFEDPQKTNDAAPLFWLPGPEKSGSTSLEDWFVQVIPNKYPALISHDDRTCSIKREHGPYKVIDGVGHHEVIITRSHDKSLGQMSSQEAELVLRTYQARYNALKEDECVAYILIFHNHGEGAGASIAHPHSQLIAMPIVPPDVSRSFRGSEQFFKDNKACIHCTMLKWERGEQKRIVYENAEFLVLAPYASHTSYELRIYPKGHDCNFELLEDVRLSLLAEALTAALGKLYTALGNPAYNFFIHTTPVDSPEARHYHWHIEILPKTGTPAGLELGADVDVAVARPEDVPGILEQQ